MKQHNSQRPSQHSRMPLVVNEGRRILRSSARRAGAVANRFARRGRRIVGETVQQTGRLARNKPWIGLGTALCTGLCFGALASWLYFRD